MPETKLIVSGSRDKTVRIWNYETKEMKLTINEHSGSVNSVIAIPTSDYIVSGSSDTSIKIWNY